MTIEVTLAGANLMASSVCEEPSGAQGALTYEALAPIVEEAADRWSDSVLVDDSALALLDEVSFEIADLAGLTLGHARGTTVWIDLDAAGFGWFVDPTPYEDTEFRRGNEVGELTALPSSPAYGEMDLLTVVMHELGHVFGLEDLDPEETHDGCIHLMSATLDAGARHVAVQADIRSYRTKRSTRNHLAGRSWGHVLMRRPALMFMKIFSYSFLYPSPVSAWRYTTHRASHILIP